MSSTSSIDSAIAALGTIVQQLEASSARRTVRDDMLKGGDAELALMRMDRSRLADELDAALARGNALDAARVDVASRLDRAISTVRDTLGKI